MLDRTRKNPDSIALKVASDVNDPSGKKDVNRKFFSLVRFLNIYVAVGIKVENI